MNRMWKAAAAMRFANRRRGSTLSQPPTVGAVRGARRRASVVPEPLESRVLMTYVQSSPVYTLTEPGGAVTKDSFGHSLTSVGGDVVVGSPLTKGTKTTNAGAVYRITPSTGAVFGTYSRNVGGDEMGWSVAANANGNLASGGQYATANGMTTAGVAASYDASTTITNGLTFPTATDATPDPTTGGYFGSVIASQGNYVLVGNQVDNTMGSNVGGAFLYDRQGDLLCKYYPPVGQANARFGWSVGFLSNGNVVIGARSDVNSGTADGSVYVMSGTATGTCRTAILHIADPGGKAGDSFGYALATNGTTIAVGTPVTVPGTPAKQVGGVVYVFNGATGALAQTFYDPSPSDSGESFGNDVALSGDGRLLVGIPLKQIVTNYYTGQAEMFDLGTGALTHVFNDPTPTGNGELGLGLAFLAGGNVAVSAPTHAVGSVTVAGEVLVFTPGDVAPVANAGSNQQAPLGTGVVLSGAASTDANGNDQIVSYAWDTANTGNYSTPGQTLSFNPQAPGTYTVGLKVTDCYGLSRTATVTVTVADVAPTASVTGPPAVNVGQWYTPQAAFSAPIADTSGYTVGWSFGDGNTIAPHAASDQNAMNPIYTFSAAGTCTVTFTVYDPWGVSTSATTTVVIS